MEVRLSAGGGRIEGIAFCGGSLSSTPLDGLVEALEGVSLRRDDVDAVLRRFPLPELFGTITREELLDTIFDAP